MTKSIEEFGILPELKSFPIFNSIPEDQIKTLCANSQVVVCNHREALFDSGSEAQYFYVALSGAFKLSKPTAGGESTIIHFSPPGDVIAAFIMTQASPRYPLSAIAMGPSRALKIPRANYLETWRHTSELILKVQNLLSSRMTALQNQKALSKAPLQAKVASLLVQLIEPKNMQNENKVLIPIPLTRKEIADCVGSTVESIIRIMSEWTKIGIVSTNEQQITIIQPDQLMELSTKEF